MPQLGPGVGFDGVGLVTDLYHRFTGAVQQNLRIDNEILRITNKLKDKNAEKPQGNIAINGVIQLATNRGQGMLNINRAWQNAKDGSKWIHYWAHCPEVQKHVDHAATAHIKSMWPTIPSPDKIKRYAATAYTTRPQDIVDLKDAYGERIVSALEVGAAAAVAGVIVSKALKHGAAKSATGWRHYGWQTARVSWGVMGLGAICFGLGKLDEAMSSHGVFSQTMREHRDEFNRNKAAEWNEAVEKFNAMRDAGLPD